MRNVKYVVGAMYFEHVSVFLYFPTVSPLLEIRDQELRAPARIVDYQVWVVIGQLLVSPALHW